LKVVSEIHDPVTTTDELIPSGETSSYRSNPLGLAEFALSRKDPEYVGRAKEVQKVEKAREEGKCMCEYSDEYKKIMETIKAEFADVNKDNVGVGSTIYAVKPGDGSARAGDIMSEGSWWMGKHCSGICHKRYRSTLSTGVCFHLFMNRKNFHLEG
ncbi:MAG: hydratase, partial [Eubacterium sp.]